MEAVQQSPPTDVPLFYSKNPTGVLFRGGLPPTGEISVGKIPIQKLRIEKFPRNFSPLMSEVPIQGCQKYFEMKFCGFLFGDQNLNSNKKSFFQIKQ